MRNITYIRLDVLSLLRPSFPFPLYDLESIVLLVSQLKIYSKFFKEIILVRMLGEFKVLLKNISSLNPFPLRKDKFFEEVRCKIFAALFVRYRPLNSEQCSAGVTGGRVKHIHVFFVFFYKKPSKGPSSKSFLFSFLYFHIKMLST